MNTHLHLVLYLGNTNRLSCQSQSLGASCQHLLFSRGRSRHRRLARRTAGSCAGCSGPRPSASGTGATLQSGEKNQPSVSPLLQAVLQGWLNPSGVLMFWEPCFDFFPSDSYVSKHTWRCCLGLQAKCCFVRGSGN